jgi:hypothetical protein
VCSPLLAGSPASEGRHPPAGTEHDTPSEGPSWRGRYDGAHLNCPSVGRLRSPIDLPMPFVSAFRALPLGRAKEGADGPTYPSRASGSRSSRGDATPELPLSRCPAPARPTRPRSRRPESPSGPPPGAITIEAGLGRPRPRAFSTRFTTGASASSAWRLLPRSRIPTDADFDGGIPSHGQGFVTTPRVAPSLRDGAVLVAGVEFYMPGDWVLRAVPTSRTESDQVTLPVSIAP